ncbi:MAG: Gfo/Idh/MocA family oxidoreductase [Verrucomicrobiae bacterium]|nr:Gfo/Idh/MocA family oxidoreductase [Verrucomicrobiae bacterium]
MLKAGIIGYGYMGEIRHQNVLKHPELDLLGICDPGKKRAIEKQNCPAFSDFEELLSLKPDVVFICTPNNITPDAAIAGLQAGAHVFCEKPPGRSLADIERIREVEAAHPNLRLIFGFNHRHHPGITDAKAIVDGGALGRLLWLRGVYGKSGGHDFEKSWRNDPKVGGGGILLDQGIHMLDLFRFFCGDFEEVQSMAATAFWNIPVEDNAFVHLRAKGGPIAQLHSSSTLWKHTFRLELGLERGYLTVTGLLSKTGSYGRETLLVGRKPRTGERAAVGNPREEITYYDEDPSWDIQVQHFVECILNGRAVEDSTSDDALAVMKIIDTVYRQNGLRLGEEPREVAVP